MLAAVWGIARIPPGWILRRAVIELPFVVLAVLLPVTGPDPRIDVLGVALSEPGLLGAWNIVVKGTLGVLISLTLAATTPLRDLLLGLQRLRAPALVITIATLMLRYLDVIVAEAGRMRLARLARGHDPRFLWQVGATARGVGALFVRAYERGERVHLAMLSRGFDGAAAAGRRGRPEPPPVGRGPGPRRGGRPAGRRRLERRVTEWATCAATRPRPVLAGRRPWTSAAWPSPTPTGTRPCTGSTCASSRASGSRCSGRTAPARRRWCCTSTASCAPAPAA